MKRLLAVLGSWLGLVSGLAWAAAPNGNSGALIIFAWDNQLWAQSTTDPANLQALGAARQGLEIAFDTPQSYTWQAAGLPQPPPAPYGIPYGFTQGVRSPDGSHLAYLQIEHGGPGYQIWDKSGVLLFESDLSAQRGFLVPLGWTVEGDLLLLERYLMHNLETIRIWRQSEGRILPEFNGAPGHLRGRSALMPDGNAAFIGFDTDEGLGYIYDFQARSLIPFPISITLPDLSERGSMFELFPLLTLGVIPTESLTALQDRLLGVPYQPTPYPEPFLYWALPDEKRRITCYPDSSYTRAQHPVTCPALGTMYEGHQGTDVGQRPNGLPRGTDVYAMFRGVVFRINDTCEENSPSCGRAYGNFIGLEHVLAVNGNLQSWYTGYAHLSAVLVTEYASIQAINVPIGKSGATGSGGPHLHMEVRFPHGWGETAWIDPWDTRYSPDAHTLWVGNTTPTSAAEVLPPN